MKKTIKKSILNKFLRTFALFLNILSKLKRTRAKKSSTKYKIKRHRIKYATDNQKELEVDYSHMYHQYICQDGKFYTLSPHRFKTYNTEKQSTQLKAIRLRMAVFLFLFILAYVALNNYLIMFVYHDSQNLKSNNLNEKNKYFFSFISFLSVVNKKKNLDYKNLKTNLNEDNSTILIDRLDLDFGEFDKNLLTVKYAFLSESYFEEANKSNKQTNELNGSCVLPKLDPYEKELMQFVKKEKKIVCNPKQNWIYVENGTIRMSKTAIQKHGVIVCAYIPIYRGNSDFKVHEGSRIFPVMDRMPLISDFFKIDCRSKNGAIYSNIHSGIAYDSSLHIRHMWNPLPKKALGYNVLMFGFDSVSRMSWIRMLPKSYAYMIEQGFVILKGYNIVGDGTPQALLPILTGKNETELHEARRGFANATHVDDFPWIWNEFKNAGYVTQWAEDMQSIGTFQLRMLGFKQQPVDHYMRLFYLEAEKYYSRFKRLCLGSISRHENMMNWIKEFFSVYDSKPKFSFIFHSEASHNYNNPLSLLDDDLKKFLQYLKTSGIMDNTVLMFMSDHGVRVSDIRKYSQGKLEERLPFFSVLMPRSFQEKYPKQMKNLRLNSRKLTTPFDINETFKHLLNFDNYEREEKKLSRGISLFKHIPLHRSCEDAQIEAHWCSCLNWKSIDILSDGKISRQKIVQNASPVHNRKSEYAEINSKNISKLMYEKDADFKTLTDYKKYSSFALFIALESVKFINSLIDKELEAHCQKLHLKSIHRLSSLIINKQLLAFKQSKDIHGREAMFEDTAQVDKHFKQDILKPFEKSEVKDNNSTKVNDHLNIEHVYQIVLSTFPGNGTFELSCKHNRYSGKTKFNKNEISRINSYKSSANCIMNKRPDLRQYCFCK